MTMYDRIRALRLKKGMSQQELARLTGYRDRSSIAKIESGYVDLPQSKILLFAKALNITPENLMGLKGPYPEDLVSDFWGASDEDKIELFNREGGTPAMSEEVARAKQRLGMPVVTDPDNPPLQLCPHERTLILSYRKADAGTRAAVEKLLDLNTVPAQPREA